MLTVFVLLVLVRSGNTTILNQVTNYLYELNPLKITEKPNFVVGRILSDKETIFFITDIFYYQAGSTIPEQPEVTTSGWEMLAINTITDDCSDETLKNYPKRRSCFCIGHSSGVISTTSYFSQVEQKAGARYEMTLITLEGNIYSSNNLRISVTLFSVCDNITMLYESIQLLCGNSYSYVTDLISTMPITLNTQKTLYVSGIKYNITSPGSIPKGSKINFNVSKNLDFRAFSFIYLNAAQLILVKPPLKLKPDETLFLRTNMSSNILFTIQLIAVEENDFCSSKPECINITKQYLTEQDKLNEDCPCIDQYGFIAKYAYCDDNKAPIFNTTIAFLDWDKMEKTQTSVPIISNFLYDPEGKPLQYIIKRVQATYSSPQSNATFYEQFCGSAFLNTYAWFCFNSTSGTMYSTYNLLGKVTPDEVFIVSIEISDVELYPPRKTSGDLKILCQSLCTKLTSAYRNLIQKCNSVYFEGTLNNGTILTVSKPGDSSFTRIDDDIYYITGLKILTNFTGDYMEILITQHDRSATANYFYNGYYALLDHPLLVKSGYVYNVTFNIKQNLSPNLNDFTMLLKNVDFTFLLIRQEDYCGLTSLACTNYFKIYNDSLFENTAIKSTCAEVDVFGMRAKYGYCNVSSAPSVIRTDFYLDLNDEYVFIEVIPGNFSMYVNSTNPLKYYFTTPDNYVIKSNATFPSNCSLSLNEFCINNSTGRIYTSSGIFGRLSPNLLFNFAIEVVDDTDYPIRSLNLNLHLLITDRCYPSNTIYNSIIEQCVNYASLISVREDKTQQFIFNLKNPLERIISFEINSLNLLNKFSSVGIDAAFYFKGELNIISSDKMHVTVPALNIQLKIPLNISNMNITVYGYSFDKINIFYLISELKLKFLSSYICNNQCMTNYRQWLDESKAIPNCNKDFYYLSYNFDVCNDPETTFVGKPTLSNDAVKFKQNVVINSMIYTSPFEFNSKYWLKDGIKISPMISNAEIISQLSKESLKNSYLLHEYNVGGLLLNNLTFSDQGYYQCVVENDYKSFYSEKIKLQLSDYTCAKANLTMSEKMWIDQYSNNSTNEYHNLINELQTTYNASNKGITFQDVLFYNSNENVGVSLNIFYPILKGNRTQSCIDIITLFATSAKDLKLCDCCLSETVGDDDYTGNYTFPVTLAGTVSSLPCVKEKNKSIQRQCIGGVAFSQWENADLLSCPPEWEITQNLVKLKNVTAANVVNTTSTLSEILRNGTLKSIYDIDLISSVIQNIINVNSSSEVVTSGILSSVDNLLSSSSDWIIKANKKFDSSAVFLSQLEALAKQQTKNITVPGKNLGFSSYTTKTNQNSLYIYSQLNESAVSVNILSNDLWNDSINYKAYIVLPSQLLTEQYKNQIYSYVFFDKTFFTKNEDNLDSVILSATLNGKNVTNSSYPISMMFLPDTSVAGNRSCHFYKMEDKSWSSDGCYTTSDSSSSKILCKCNHLTNFALILDVDQSGNNPLTLQVISWIGCGISIAGLLITIISYSAFRKLRMNLAPKILINLCISLMATLVLFLVLVERTQPRVLCQAVASLLQFFILSTFFWMAVEGLNLYRMFVKVFRGSSSSRIFMLKSSAFAWGTPLVVTIITAAIKPDKLGPKTDSDPKICVVRGIPFYFGILLPVCVVMVGNIIILVLVLKGIVGNSKLANDSKSKKKDHFAKVRIALSCSVLLGTTWIFAILAVGDLRDVFQWLFCIFNSLQGFFIFVFYTARNREVKYQWLIFFGVKNAARDPRSSTSDMSQKTRREKIAFSIQRSSTEISSEKKSNKAVLNVQS